MTRVYIAGIAVLVLGIGGALLIEGWREDGRDEVREEIEIENQETADEADEAGARLRRCHESGGVYDFATGVCGAPEGRDGQ